MLSLSFSKVLQQCVALEHLEIMTDCQAIPVDAAVPSLKSLKSCSRYMSDAVLLAIGRRCAELETLEIFEPAEFTSDFEVTDAGLRAVLQGCPLLREIDVEKARGIISMGYARNWLDDSVLVIYIWDSGPSCMITLHRRCSKSALDSPR
jgi:hypothetical protein